tara:strand:+ start:8452 stop:9015 length:564 start_codon:yes stop_codon:yes gene_type:complete
MIKEKKFVFLAVLTFLLYGLGLYMDYDSFILPFPLFDFVLLIAVLRFFFWDSSSLKTYKWLYFFGVLFKLSINPVLTEAILSNNQLDFLHGSLLIDSMLLMAYGIWALSFTFWCIQNKLAMGWYWTILHFILGALVLTSGYVWLTPLFSLLPAILLYVKNREEKFRYIWHLHFALDTMTVIMLLSIS